MKNLLINRHKIFGTDGIRGTPGVYPLTDDMLAVISRAIGWKISHSGGRRKPKAVIGKDTRLSGGKIESILSSHIKSYGADVCCAGTITTPGLSFLSKELKADIGIMISASHNKAQDNGIKFFNSKGHKYRQEEEEEIEDVIFQMLAGSADFLPGKRKGSVIAMKDAQDKYVDFLTGSVGRLDLSGMTVALDCAWGAASPFGRKVFEQLGARVFSIHDKPSGHNINEGGAVNPTLLKKLVLETEADIGVAVDGDGDRGILVDEKGQVLDGDAILAVIARNMMGNRKLTNNTIVATVMSNVGLKVSLEQSGARMICTDVGDKFVLEALLKNGLNLGGEQSGHIIFLDHLATPDGLLTALQMLRVVRETSTRLSGLRSCITRYPQVLVNVRVKEKRPFAQMPQVLRRLKECEAQLKEQGRILLRYSGTETLARVMVEGSDKTQIEAMAESIAELIRQEIGEAVEEKRL
ncbi:MAG: phosphoglucosamine mutase [Deltaproteobacteria bacterium]